MTLADILPRLRDAGPAVRRALRCLLTMLERGDELARCGVSEAELHALRCAVIYEAVAQIDVESRLLMLRDERVVAFDSAYLA